MSKHILPTHPALVHCSRCQEEPDMWYMDGTYHVSCACGLTTPDAMSPEVAAKDWNDIARALA
jgi:hypothetical protein